MAQRRKSIGSANRQAFSPPVRDGSLSRLHSKLVTARLASGDSETYLPSEGYRVERQAGSYPIDVER